MAAEEEVEITLTRDSEDDPYCTVWVGPPDTQAGVECGRFPGTVFKCTELRRKIDRLAVEIYMKHREVMATEGDQKSTFVDDGKWRSAEPS